MYKHLFYLMHVFYSLLYLHSYSTSLNHIYGSQEVEFTHDSQFPLHILLLPRVGLSCVLSFFLSFFLSLSLFCNFVHFTWIIYFSDHPSLFFKCFLTDIDIIEFIELYPDVDTHNKCCNKNCHANLTKKQSCLRCDLWLPMLKYSGCVN